MIPLLLLVCCCSNIIVNNSVYAVDLNEQMENFKTEMLTVISMISVKIDNVDSKVDTMQQDITNIQEEMSNIKHQISNTELMTNDINVKAGNIQEEMSNMKLQISNNELMTNNINVKVGNIQDEMTNMKLLFGSNGLIANEINQKISLLPTQILNMELNLGTSIKDTFVYEIKELQNNISLVEEEQENRIMNHFEEINNTLGSLEKKCNENQEKLNMVNNSIETGSIDVKILDIDNDLLNITSDIILQTAVNKSEVIDINSQADHRLSLIPCQQTGPPSRNCADLYSKGCKSSESAEIFPYSSSPGQGVYVLCDHVSDGGQWTIIQRRQDVEPREDFDRSWEEYVEGFGDLDGEFWVGLKLIHELTTHSKQELHILLEDWDGETRWAKYSNFSIESAEDNYRINITGYSGDAGDAMDDSNGAAFSTRDRDNDDCSCNCASRYNGGGWWYNYNWWDGIRCAGVQLNGEAHHGADTPLREGILWDTWHGDQYSLRGVTMMIRPATTE